MSEGAAARPLARLSAGAFKYVLLVVVPALVALFVLQAGSRIEQAPPSSHARPPAADARMPDLGLLLAQIMVVLVAARACGLLMRRLGQPQVVGEMLAGVLLGPSLLGWLLPGASAALFPAASLGFLSSLSQVGMVLFMFLVGTSLDTGSLRERPHAAILASHASIVVPFALGVTLALPLHGRFAPAGVGFLVFALFLGAAMSVTAFPVLARILAERGLLQTPLGALATSAAAVDDVTAWTILAAIIMVAESGTAGGQLWLNALGVALFVLAVYAVRKPARRVIRAAFERHGTLTHDQVALLVFAVLVGACITEALGVHALFGAFFVGAALASEREVVQAARERLQDLLVVVLLPIYFAFTGLRTRLDLLVQQDLLGWTLAVLAVAVAGKLGGCALAARASGASWREAASLGILMNTRGLMELVILNIGLDLGVLSPALYSMFVLMAFVTTTMTTPLLSAIEPKRAAG